MTDVELLPPASADVYGAVVGQPRAVAALKAAAANPVHAYMLVGSPGVGRREAALGFAASLLCEHGQEVDDGWVGCGVCTHCDRILKSAHPDVIVTERTGAALLTNEAGDIVRLAHTSPTECRRKVIIIEDGHLAERMAPKLLKTIEEPPPTAEIIVLADFVSPELVTIASRCVRIDMGPVPIDELTTVIREMGQPEAEAKELALAARGRLDRARLLAADPQALVRHRTWLCAPGRLDGTGAAASTLAAEITELTDALVVHIKERQAREIEVAAEIFERYGQKPLPTAERDKRFARELRRARANELRAGLATLASVYRDRMVDNPGAVLSGAAAIAVLEAASEAIDRNAAESLMLQALFTRLSRLL